MKPSDKEISDLQCRIERALAKENLSYADLAKITSVHASQVSRICSGDFKTFSNNVVQICKALKIRVPRIDEEDDVDIEWAKVHASLRRIWDQTPEGAAMIRRVLDAIADLRASHPADHTEPLP